MTISFEDNIINLLNLSIHFCISENLYNSYCLEIIFKANGLQMLICVNLKIISMHIFIIKMNRDFLWAHILMWIMLHLLRHSRLKLYYSSAEYIFWLQAKKFIILIKCNDSHLWFMEWYIKLWICTPQLKILYNNTYKTNVLIDVSCCVYSSNISKYNIYILHIY